MLGILGCAVECGSAAEAVITRLNCRAPSHNTPHLRPRNMNNITFNELIRTDSLGPANIVFISIAVFLAYVVAALLPWASALVRKRPDQTPSSKASSGSIKDSKRGNVIQKRFRISHIPRSITKDALRLWLQDKSIASENVIQLSTAPYTAQNPNFDVSIASVDSSYSQAIITTSEDSISQIFDTEHIKGPGDCEFSVDSHFQGMTVLYADEDVHATNEIAAE
jgi:hypothetical protein